MFSFLRGLKYGQGFYLGKPKQKVIDIECQIKREIYKFFEKKKAMHRRDKLTNSIGKIAELELFYCFF